jgi:hypothetical protein
MARCLLGDTVEYHEITQFGQSASEREFEQIPLTCKTVKLSTQGDVSVTANINNRLATRVQSAVLDTVELP